MAVVLALALGSAPPALATGTVHRIAVTDNNLDDLVVAGGRVFWSTWGSRHVSVFSSFPAGDLRRLLQDDADPYDELAPRLWASAARVAVQIDTYTAGIDEDYTDTIAFASAPVSATGFATLVDGDLGYERIQDVDGHRVLTTAVKRVGTGRTLRVYVRDLASPTRAARAIGQSVELDASAVSGDVQARIAGRYVAVWRSNRVTVRDLYSGRAKWSVRLPARGRGSQGLQASAAVVWDLAADGSLAVARAVRETGPAGGRNELGWAPARGAYRRLTGRVVVRRPFALREGSVTYVRPDGARMVRLVERPLGQLPRALTGTLPRDSLLAVDPNVVAAVVPGTGPRRCVLAAVRPATVSNHWTCR